MSKAYQLNKALEMMRVHWPEAVSLETELYLSMSRLSEVIDQNSANELEAYGLTNGAFEVLVALRGRSDPKEMSPSDLYRSLLKTSGGMTKILKQLEEDNLIVRIDHETDKRSKMVRLTQKGKDVAEQAMQSVMAGDRRLLYQNLSKDETQSLRDMLLNVVNKLGV
ncbi:Multiple antibiotic resistance protein MarR [Pseudovibrio axinellae]|uniref:Multiple antibiotic resistance protein MarR n=1 Tax=Pseudovibrio axinellae TaxID=989403 RepID=A0A165YM45_9HYPH|nr:MarR family transcriptional regulator [Pseudovibrio axinellae]KZL18974.1 Multiple antibiotic resistance protein MarR [Pseudovibrio axinellae]SEP85520.1 DNA-binding transcriptional regulator, MarR family [Pseudovibrio axinellae]